MIHKNANTPEYWRLMTKHQIDQKCREIRIARSKADDRELRAWYDECLSHASRARTARSNASKRPKPKPDPNLMKAFKAIPEPEPKAIPEPKGPRSLTMGMLGAFSGELPDDLVRRADRMLREGPDKKEGAGC